MGGNGCNVEVKWLRLTGHVLYIHMLRGQFLGYFLLEGGGGYAG